MISSIVIVIISSSIIALACRRTLTVMQVVCRDHVKCTHVSFPIRRQRDHPGVVLPLEIYDSAKHSEGIAVMIELN